MDEDLLERAKILLKATKDLLDKQDNSHYVLNLLSETVFYYGSECDGDCLKDDIGYFLDQLEEQEKLNRLLDKVEKRYERIPRREAIERIKIFLEECAEKEDELTYVTSYDADALGTAIKSLEQEPCDDAVSRQAVLNTLNNMDSALDENRTIETYKELLTACYNDLPSVTPTQKQSQNEDE